MDDAKKVKMFGLDFESCDLPGAVDRIIASAIERKKGLVVTPNVDHVVMLQDDPFMLEVFQAAMFRFADGMPLVWFSKIVFGQSSLPSRVTGADLLIELCRASVGKGLSVYFLGGNPGVAEQAALELSMKFPGLRLAGVYCPPFGFENDEQETSKIVTQINDSNADILFIGVGAPKQEKWAHSNFNKLNTGPILGIGAAFDFASGIQKRAPVIFQNMGLEWAWRLLSEPRRLWRRYLLRDSRFLGIAFREYLKIKSAK